jgi:hypothetical protein
MTEVGIKSLRHSAFSPAPRRTDDAPKSRCVAGCTPFLSTRACRAAIRDYLAALPDFSRTLSDCKRAICALKKKKNADARGLHVREAFYRSSPI